MKRFKGLAKVNRTVNVCLLLALLLSILLRLFFDMQLDLLTGAIIVLLIVGTVTETILSESWGRSKKTEERFGFGGLVFRLVMGAGIMFLVIYLIFY
ncbi:hypothetical protein [Staphylospora marina]|uniref:hypothetical protein n=1 Tax=Staphylospora marina TaxID=2490858 RepID=UPI000F5BEF2B|nr:hypothetical protein [Staphylospora marina]